MRTISVSNEKGGVGKTTTAVNVAAGLAAAGRHVLLVDLDSQGNCAAALGIRVSGLTMVDVLLKRCGWREAIIEARPGLDLLPSNPGLADAKDELIARAAADAVVAMSRGKRARSSPTNFLAEGLHDLTGYDYTLIDCAPSRDVLNGNALRYASEVLMPVSVDYLATVGAGQHLGAIRDAQGDGATLRLRYVVPTFFDRRTIKARAVLAELQQFFGHVVTEPIPINVSVAEAPSHGLTIFEYAPESTGAAAYGVLVERVNNGG